VYHDANSDRVVNEGIESWERRQEDTAKARAKGSNSIKLAAIHMLPGEAALTPGIDTRTMEHAQAYHAKSMRYKKREHEQQIKLWEEALGVRDREVPRRPTPPRSVTPELEDDDIEIINETVSIKLPLK
jgi:hypothetical protein